MESVFLYEVILCFLYGVGIYKMEVVFRVKEVSIRGRSGTGGFSDLTKRRG